MFNHCVLGVVDLEAAITFYDATLKTLGHSKSLLEPGVRCMYPSPEGTLVIGYPINGEAASISNGATLAFKAKDTASVDAWFKAGLIHGGTACEDPPGIRERGGIRSYLAYLRDPSGNKLAAACRI